MNTRLHIASKQMAALIVAEALDKNGSATLADPTLLEDLADRALLAADYLIAREAATAVTP